MDTAAIVVLCTSTYVGLTITFIAAILRTGE